MVEYQDIVDRLSQLGYTVVTADQDTINFELTKWLNYTVNFCNFASSDDIPELLDPRIIDKVCSWVLYYKKNLGQLEDFDYGGAIKQLKEGDTSISYTDNGSESDESRFDKVLTQLDRGFDKWLTPHRKLRW